MNKEYQIPVFRQDGFSDPEDGKNWLYSIRKLNGYLKLH